MKPLLVGELNPYGPSADFALYPSPTGSAGWRLCHKVLGLDEETYLIAYDRMNLCAHRWSIRAARDVAALIRAEREGGVLVLLGAKVCSAFGWAYQPFTQVRENAELPPRAVILPHPSGRSRAWQEPHAVWKARARHALRVVDLPVSSRDE